MLNCLQQYLLPVVLKIIRNVNFCNISLYAFLEPVELLYDLYRHSFIKVVTFVTYILSGNEKNILFGKGSGYYVTFVTNHIYKCLLEPVEALYGLYRRLTKCYRNVTNFHMESK